MHWSYMTTSRKLMRDYLAAMNLKATSHAYPKRKKYTKLMKLNPQKKVLYLKLP